jgi:uncharacterized membrane protein
VSAHPNSEDISTDFTVWRVFQEAVPYLNPVKSVAKGKVMKVGCFKLAISQASAFPSLFSRSLSMNAILRQLIIVLDVPFLVAYFAINANIPRLIAGLVVIGLICGVYSNHLPEK